MTPKCLFTVMSVILLVIMVFAGGTNAAIRRSSCLECHRALSGRISSPVAQWEKSVHGSSGVGCHDCHGGDPWDMDRAMDPGRGFTGKPSADRITEACGTCHSDAQRMKLHRARIDQAAMYLSGEHSAALESGKTAPTCTSCHGAHGTLPVDDPLSRAYPVNVPELCAGCHGPKNLTDYLAGAHGKALVENLNLRAPTCGDCHGVHGTVAAVPVQTPLICGRCHPTEARRFNEGPHRNSLDRIGQPGCTQCHDAHRLSSALPEEIPERIITVCPECHPGTGSEVVTGQVMAAELEATMQEVYLARLWAEQISMHGLDTTHIDILIQEAGSWINRAVPAVHSADTEILKELTGMARDKVKGAREHSAGLQMELGFRRVVFFLLSLTSMIIVVLLILKLRQLERDRPRQRVDGGTS